ncbi:virion structural protein [Dinoroseobacter phage DFL12phi1]|uniref:Virion protein n=2 Tax=Baltimorevirus DFL12 TaxID=2169868 RepID=A0A023NHF3_9CAUD|nr:virion structural protein [Dinoroseobacter phage DFL12phi1]AHX01050.1 hypothetical protein DFL12P1_0004 [Dinoroseobacter phage DFL12phi1]AID16895.1 hypothetical protein vBDshPR2C_80 [Dinoroseobacter phage vBDshPR2C]
MPQECSTNYVCTPIWYTQADMTENGGNDVVAKAAGPHAQDLNVTCVVKTGTVQFQVKDEQGNWFTPSEASYTVNDSNLVRLPRANMPDIRIIATADATFYVEGPLR